MAEDEVSNVEKPVEKELRQPTPERFYSDVGQVTADLLEALGVALSTVKTMDYVERTRNLAFSARCLANLLDQLIEEWQREGEKEHKSRT